MPKFIAEIAATPVRDVLHRLQVVAREETTLREVLGQMARSRRGSVVVHDNAGKVVGLFTESDVMRAVDHSNTDWHTLPVRQVMTRNPRTINASGTLGEALKLMRDGGFRRLPIVADDGRGLGTLSIRDIISHVAALFPQEFMNLPPDPAHEAHKRWGG